MSLADALRASARSAGTPCMTGRLLDDLNDDDRAVLVDALDLDSGITHAQIARALVSQGHRIGQHSIGRHRKGECACEPR